MSEIVRERALSHLGRILHGKWTLEELVGLGGMAAVYKARHRNGSTVAIKLLHATLAEFEDVRRRFIGEGFAASRIQHPSIVKVIDDDVDEKGTPYLVMEFVEGKTLADAIEDQRFGDQELLDVAEQICSALVATHAAGVVHRDLKPDNVLLEPDGRVRLLDFGIARLLADEEQSFFETKTGIAFGTPGFIAPEQALGHRTAIGPRTDLFALGATLFYLASGRFLHATDSPQELLILVATRQGRCLGEVAPHVSPEVAAIIDRATRMHIEDRWPSAAEMLAEIRRVKSLAREQPPAVQEEADDHAASSFPTRRLSDPGTRPSIVRKARSRRVRVLALAGVASLLSLAFVPAIFGAPRAGVEPPPVETASACAVEVPPEPPLPPEIPVASIPPVVVVAESKSPPPRKPRRDPNQVAEALRHSSVRDELR